MTTQLKTQVVFPENKLIEKDSIAIYTEKETIFSLFPSCIKKVCENVGFKEFAYIYQTNPENGFKFTDIYSDNFKNNLLVEYTPSVMRIKYDNLCLDLIGFLISSEAKLYLERSGSIIKINFRDYVKLYKKNVFNEVVEKIIEHSIKKELELSRIFI